MQTHRAYSLLTVKAVDGEKRIISGVATTPETDRVGDIVDPTGVEFNNPLPLLLYHDTQRPVGTVRFQKPTSKGIAFEASLPQITEPGTLKDRVDEAWQSIKAGLVKGVSIGFRALEDGIELLKTGGIKFTHTEVLELSLVTVPANASAVIETIKSLDAPFLAASGATESTHTSQVRDAVRAVKLPRRSSAMTTKERISQFEATRQAKQAEIVALQEKVESEGRTKDADEKVKFDELKSEIKSIDDELSDLSDLEKLMVEKAAPVVSTTPQQMVSSRGPAPVVRVSENLPKGQEFIRLVMCKAAAFVQTMNGNFTSAAQVAKERYPDNPRIIGALEQKAAVAPALSTGTTWAGPLIYAETLSQEFIDYLRPQTLVGRIPGLTRVPANVRIVGQTSGGEGYWVGQGKPKPLTKFDFSATTLGFAKIAAISVISEEVAMYSSPSAEDLVRRGLSDAIVNRMDIDFIDPAKAAVSNVSPASITNGLSALSPSGTTADDIRADIASLLSTYIAANVNPAGLVLIMPNIVAMVIGLLRNSLGQREFPDINMNGGMLENIPVVTTQNAAFAGAGNLVVALNAPDILLNDDGAVTVDVSREAALEMSDGPTQDGSAGTGASLVSLWQNNLIGLRAERHVNWAKRRSNAVAYMDNVLWGGAASPA